MVAGSLWSATDALGPGAQVAGVMASRRNSARGPEARDLSIFSSKGNFGQTGAILLSGWALMVTAVPQNFRLRNVLHVSFLDEEGSTTVHHPSCVRKGSGNASICLALIEFRKIFRHCENTRLPIKVDSVG